MHKALGLIPMLHKEQHVVQMFSPWEVKTKGSEIIIVELEANLGYIGLCVKKQTRSGEMAWSGSVCCTSMRDPSSSP